MKEDYLWDKTGENPEIEKLENVLKAFCFQETAPPEIPAKIIPFETKTPHGFFRFACAFAACLVFFIIILSVWLQISNKQTPQINEFANIEKLPEEKAVVISNESTTEEVAVDLPVEKAANNKQKPKLLTAKAQKIVTLKKSAEQNFKSKSINLKLTKDEEYAYRQLMLALSITSSKLKLVKDKVDGIEEQIAVNGTEK